VLSLRGRAATAAVVVLSLRGRAATAAIPNCEQGYGTQRTGGTVQGDGGGICAGSGGCDGLAIGKADPDFARVR